MKEFLEALEGPDPVPRSLIESMFTRLVQGELNDVEITTLLVGLKLRGETPEVLAGAASALRQAAHPFPRPAYDYADPCGTGGDASHTVNVSTAVAIVAAALELPIAKHGNRSVSSQCGSADVLEAVGIPTELPPERARRCLDEAGICFLFAPQYHGGLRNAMTVRRTLRTRTIFNLLGPLLNPAQPPYQVVGVYDPAWCRPVAETLGLLGCRAALVVHGSGLDELALHGPTQAVLWRDGRPQELRLDVQDAGLSEHALETLRGGSPDDNARWLTGLLRGEGDEPHRAAVAFNAGALLWVSGRADSIRDGTRQALEVLGTSRPFDTLQHWKEVATHGAG